MQIKCDFFPHFRRVISNIIDSIFTLFIKIADKACPISILLNFCVVIEKYSNNTIRELEAQPIF